MANLTDYGYRKVASETQPDKKPGFMWWFWLSLVMAFCTWFQVTGVLETIDWVRELLHWS